MIELLLEWLITTLQRLLPLEFALRISESSKFLFCGIAKARMSCPALKFTGFEKIVDSLYFSMV